MKVVVGLGNPGQRYAATRHNVGFMTIDVLAEKAGCPRFQSRFQAELADVTLDSQRVILAKPQTFMNLSGQCVRQIMDFYQLEREALLVVCDDVNLPLGRLRARARGTHGGHNGLRDIQKHLGTTEYSRLRLGVGAAEGRDLAEHVLDRFQPGERQIVQDMIIHAAQAVGVWLEFGIEACMNRFNAREDKRGSN